MKRQLVLDTSLFVNPAAAHVFGSSPTSALTAFLEQAERAPDLELLMPPSIYKELMHFAEEAKVPKHLLLLLHQLPPKKHEIKVPGIFIYDIVENLRDRVDRGLRLAERHVREALQMTPPAKEPAARGSEVRPDSEAIARLRETYRRIMREGMLDSRADVDLLLLAYEVSGTLISADEGVLLWAENLGIKILPHNQLAELLGKSLSK